MKIGMPLHWNRVIVGGDTVAPTITSANPSSTYYEGVPLGGTLTASEPVTWTVSGADASRVTLNGATGVWSLEATVYATKSSYSFTFTGTDGAGNATNQVVEITIISSTSTLALDFNGAAGVKLSTQMDLLIGEDSLSMSGAGLLNKATSTASFGLYASVGAGMRHQKVTATQPAASSGTQLAVLASDNAGLTGYLLRKSSTTAARLTRYNGGSSTILISAATITNTGAFELEATVASDGSSVTLTIRENGSVIQTYTDSSASRLTVGRTGIAYVATAAQSGIYDAMTFTADTPAGGTGLVQAKSIRIGYQTPASNGAVPASSNQLGLLQSGTVGYWEFRRVSGDATAWPTYVGNGSQTPYLLRSLTSADAGTTAVYDVIIDGVTQPTTKRLTLAVQPITETTPALSVGSQAGIGRLPKASLGGCAVEFIEGCGPNFTIGSEIPAVSQVAATFAGFNTHTGRFTIRMSPGTSDYLLGGIAISGSANIDLVGLRIHDVLDSWNGVSGTHSNYQNRPLVSIATSSSIYINGGEIGAPASALSDPTRWPTGISYVDSGDPATQQGDMQILGNLAIAQVKDGISGGNLNNFHFNGYTVRNFASNAMFLGGAKNTNGIVENFSHLISWTNPCDTGDHPDCLQIGSSTAKASYDTITVRYGVVGLTTGNKISQGPFCQDTAYNSGATSGTAATVSGGGGATYLTGFTVNNFTMKNVISADGSTVSFFLDLGTNALIDLCTAYRPPALNTTQDMTDPAPRCPTVTENVSGTVHQTTGTIQRSAFHNLGSIGGTGFTFTNNVLFDTVKGGGFTSAGNKTPGGANETARRTYYATFFGAANVQSDDPMVHARPIVGGPMKLGDGTYAGPLLPDGSWNDGLVHA